MTQSDNSRAWTTFQRTTRVLLVVGILLLFILPCPGPVISKQLAELIRKLALIQSGEGLYLVPLRWCAVEGSPSEMNPGNMGFTDTDSIFIHRMQSANDHFWIQGAEIAFHSAFTYRVEDDVSFPSIPDHYLPPNGVGSSGDINLDRYGFYEGSIAPIELVHQVADCEMAWDALELEHDTNLEGIIAVNVNRFVNASGSQSTTVGIATSSIACEPARSTTMAICTDLNTMSENIGTFVALEDASYDQDLESQDFQDVTLAHELGHTLFLGHGDGLDNDENGLFDSCCDANENESATPYSLMSPYSNQASSRVITALQKDWARTVASKTPGILIDPPAYYVDGKVISDRRVDPIQDTDNVAVDLVWAGLSKNQYTKTMVVSFKLLGILEGGLDNQYVMFLDLDNDTRTGGNPDDLGFTTGFQGAEAVVAVTVLNKDDSKEKVLEPALWVEKDGEFAEVSDSRLTAVATTIYEAESRVPLFEIISLEFSATKIRPIGDIVHFQAISQNTEGVIFDFLPDPENAVGAVLHMTPPQYPGCAPSQSKAVPGESIAVEAWGLIPDQEVEVYAARQILAVGESDREGDALLDVLLPKDINTGQQLITIRSQGTGLTADCALEILDHDQINIYNVIVTVGKLGVLAAVSYYTFRAVMKKYRG